MNLKILLKFIKKRISSSDLDYREKLYKLLINKTNNIDKFINEIINIPQLIYLQLEFPENSIEYQLLESYIEISQLLKIILESDKEDFEFIYNQLIDKFNPDSLFAFNVIRENVLRLYSRLYLNIGIDNLKLHNLNKYEVINGKEVFDIAGLEFIVYTHRDNFRLDDDFTDIETNNKRWQSKNYLCCEFASDLNYRNLSYNDLEFYNLNNSTSLIAFGNRDIFIEHTKKPLICSNDQFVNPYDMAYFQGRGYAKTEFDFLRVDNKNEDLKSEYIIVKDRDMALRLSKTGTNKIILIFDEEKHKKCLIDEMNQMFSNIKTLNYKKIYRLIALIAKFSCDYYDLSSIQERISELNDKEQFVLNDALNRYGLIEKMKVIKKQKY